MEQNVLAPVVVVDDVDDVDDVVVVVVVVTAYLKPPTQNHLLTAPNRIPF